jgi:DNA polymerase III delta prime subunit
MTHHHAVLVTSTTPLQYEVEQGMNIPPEAQYRLPQFGIGDVRALITAAHRRPLGDSAQQILLVATEFITEEAQQALLKIIEEPPVSTKFIFVIQEGYRLLPTLESRFARSEGPAIVYDTSVFNSFKQASYAERLVQIEYATKNKDHAWQIAMKQGMTEFLISKRRELTGDVLSELEYVLRLLLTRGASNKFLFEHLALTLPA